MALSVPPRIYVLAGVNGAGKSSIGGAAIRAFGGEYFNPDEAARQLRATNPKLTQTEANSAAWLQGRRLLERAISERLDFAFETTLGANTIPRLLRDAAAQGIEIHLWYAGLSSPELHIARVRARVRKGGHDITDVDIRRRYQHSRLNLIHLLPQLTELRMFDNSVDADPSTGKAPTLKLVLHMERGKIVGPPDLSKTPQWAKPIVTAAVRLSSKFT
jgi:predicted ABC-type ATPase